MHKEITNIEMLTLAARLRQFRCRTLDKFEPVSNADFNLVCHLLVLLEAHHILHVSRIRVKGEYLKVRTHFVSSMRRSGPSPKTMFDGFCARFGIY